MRIHKMVFAVVVQPLLLLLSHTSLLSAHPTTNNNLLQLPLRKTLTNTSGTSWQRRDVPVGLKNNVVQYLIDLKLGPDGQQMTFLLDTGSSDSWVFSPSACDNCKPGPYNPPSKSKSVGDLDVGYADGTSAKGHFITDEATIGSTKIKEIYLGIATESHNLVNRYPILAVGPRNTNSDQKTFPTFVESLDKANIIKSKTYSIYLNNLDASGGSIIFGGEDKTKYSGSLVMLDILKPQTKDDIPGLLVEWTSLTVTDEHGSVGTPISDGVPFRACLDTGSELTSVPLKMFAQIYNYLGGTDIRATPGGVWSIPCKSKNKAGHLTFGFGSGPAVQIQVPFSELFLPDGGNACIFGLVPRTDLTAPNIVFGDTFLRSAYMYVDLDKKKIGLAQSKKS